MNKETYEAAEKVLLAQEVQYWDWLRCKGATPNVYNAIIAAMDTYSASLIAKCESDHLSIDELLKEFTRCGFNTENWDGDEGAEKAIVRGICAYIEERHEKLFDMMTEDHLKAASLIKENEDLKEKVYAYERADTLFESQLGAKAIERKEKEIERLKGLIETAYIKGWRNSILSSPLSEHLQQFKSENNL